MSHHDLHLLRSEIKSWERDFATKHGRDPAVQDIRDQPSIAEKYKLYKKLSKKTTHPRLPAPKSRPIESVEPLPGFNPFSPVKKAAKRTPQYPNPFATPSKKKPSTAAPSPDQLPGSSFLVSTTAVSRARKRLRGEPVSPSPNKPKRQRVRSHVPASIPKSDRDSSNSEHESDHDLPLYDFASSFVADSPVKAPAGGKSFKLLFDEALPALSLPNKPIGPSLAQQRPSVDHPVPAVLKPSLDRKSERITEHQINRIQGKLSAQIFPAKNHPPAPSHKSTPKSMLSQASQSMTPMKRPLEGNDLASLQPQYPLIPPSPPPQDTTNHTGKAKMKTTVRRKKQRIEAEESDEGVDSPDDTTFKVATVRLDRSKHRHADDIEWDPLLHVGTRTAPIDDANHHASGTLTIDLPDRFRQVLAISPLRCQNSTQERVVRGLLYGDRLGHHDPSRGGDVWDAGETDEGALGDAETEDDWEGEPVPWEVGEL